MRSVALWTGIALLAALPACSKPQEPAPKQTDPPAQPAVEAPKAPAAEVPAPKPPAAPLAITALRAAFVRDNALHVEVLVDDAHDALIEAAPDDQIDALLPLSTTLLPEADRAPVSYTILTDAGPVTAALTRNAIAARGGVPHIFHVADLPAGVTDAKHLIAVLASGPLPSTARSRAAEPATAPLAAPIVQRVRDQLAASKGDPTAKDRLKPEEDLSAYRGAFGGGFTQLITYSIAYPEGVEDEHMESKTSGMFFTDDAGTIFREALTEPTTGYIEVEKVVDVEGDGVEEIIYSIAYYEGYFAHILQMKGEQVTSALLTGDGA